MLQSLYHIVIHAETQTLVLYKQGKQIKTYLISTAKNGLGERYGSYQTPRGLHQIRAKIGANMPENTVFVARRPTGERYSPEFATTQPMDRDWILTRILWLSGLERGMNRFGDVDSAKRKIYIHGTPDSTPLGLAGSRGCIRMRNADIIELFELVPVGTRVDIQTR
jgi:L,D-transpeptidase YbiS